MTDAQDGTVMKFTAADFETATGKLLTDFHHQCHAASLALVRSGVFPTSRVARGTCPGTGGQHSWVVLGMDCYNPKTTIVDPTLWSYDPTVDGVYVGPRRGHLPKGSGDIWTWGQPVPGNGPIIELDREGLSIEANSFLDILDPLDIQGWAILSSAPVGGWPAREIFEKMLDDDRLSVLIPIDIEGMLTDRNPSGRVTGRGTPASDLGGQLRMEAQA